MGIARQMSEEGIKNVLMAYSKLLLQIPQALLKKVQSRMLPQMDEKNLLLIVNFKNIFKN